MCARDFKRYRFLTKCILQDFLDGLLTDIKGNSALLFWLYLLFRLIRRDRRAGKVSAATMVYGALALAVAGFVLYVLVYSALH